MSTNERTVSLGGRLTLADVDAIAQEARVQLAPEAPARMQRSFAFLHSVLERNLPVYGLTTGCGPLAANQIDTRQRLQFQRDLIRSHAVSLGPAHPSSFVRAAMALRAHVLAQGFSGVDPVCVDILIAMLNHRVLPIVGVIGGVGASGDLVELAQIALAIIGEGVVEADGRRLPAAEGLAMAGAQALLPRFREGLALINGTSFHTGVAAILCCRARRLLCAAEVAAAMAFDALGGHVEALDPALHASRGMTGQKAAAARCLLLLEGSRLVRRSEPVAHSQDAYTLRCLPQVNGAVADSLDAAARPVEIEINAISDNPLFLVDEDRVVHGGNFHGQPVAMAIDQLKLGVVELGVISERRVARLLDASLNRGLPSFLVREGAATRSGFMGLQYCATAMAAENGILATPASARSIPTNANNQDVVSMAMVAARHAAQVLDNVERMIAIELLCAAQALELRGVDAAGRGTRTACQLIRQHSPALIDDRPLSTDVEAVQHLIGSDRFAELGEP